MPFLIDWGATPSPATTVQAVAALDAFTARHPDPEALLGDLAALGTAIDVERGEMSLTVTSAGPAGSW